MINSSVHDHFFDFFQYQFYFVQTLMVTNPQRFFRGTNGRFLHIVNELAADDTQATTAFLYLTEDEFSALSELAKEVLARRKVATCSTSNPSTEQPLFYPDVAHTYSTPNA